MKIRSISIALMISLGAAAETNMSFQLSFPRWASSLRGASVYNFDADLEGGGKFAVNRWFGEVMYGHMWSYDSFLALTFGAGQDDYHFADTPSDPWNNINNYRLGFYGQWGINDRWSVYMSPSVRAYAETGARVDDALTGAFFGGASYVVNDRLKVGPALGVIGQLEDSIRYFPVLLINWSITDTVSLDTGGGLAATMGPGLALTKEFSRNWKAGVTLRYESKRFRLDDDGIEPDGVGEDRNIPVYGILSYFLYPQGQVSTVFGYNAYGELSLHDSSGRKISNYSYDPSVGVGFIASFRF